MSHKQDLGRSRLRTLPARSWLLKPADLWISALEILWVGAFGTRLVLDSVDFLSTFVQGF